MKIEKNKKKRNAPKKPQTRTQPENISLLERCDNYLKQKQNLWFPVIMTISLITAVLLYDPRVSEGGDDSAYIVLAIEFLNEFKFANYQGPLYPVMLSLIYAIVGMSLKAFKLFSMLSMLACIYLMYRTFKDRIPATLLFAMLLLTSINSHVLYFASQTYSEAFYMLMQSLLMFLFFKFFVDNEKDYDFMSTEGLKKHLLIATVLLGAILTRTVGYTLLLAIVGYFAVYRQWKNLAWSLATFIVCFAAYQLLINLIWSDLQLQASAQANSLMNKDFYRPELGREDLSGFIVRFIKNSDQYISRFFMVMLGLRTTFTSEGFFVETKSVITIFLYLLGLTALFFSYKENKFMFFSGVTTGIFLIVTFTVLQTHWNQFRLIVPVFPMMLLLLFSGVYYILKIQKLQKLQLLFFAPAALIFFTSLSDSFDAFSKTRKLKDEFSGLSPDWFNYAKASEWVANNLPEDALVASRKPSISTIYGKGRKFQGIFSVRSGNFDAFFERWKADSVDYSIIPLSSLSEQSYNVLLGRIEARLLLDNLFYFAVKDRDFLQQFSEHFDNVEIIESPKIFESHIALAGSQRAIYYADSLLAPLRNRNVTHILTANLRLNPNIKDGNIINTVERTVIYIHDKYPNIFHRLVQIGAPDNEPAEIYLINWEMAE